MMRYEEMTRGQLIAALRKLQAERNVGTVETTPESALDEKECLLHELRAHEAELEAQNLKLLEAHQLLEESRNRYVDLYDFAPIGYVTLNDTGIIQTINQTGAAMLGLERSELIGMFFSRCVTKNDYRKFRGHLLNCMYENGPVATELHLTVKDGREIIVQLLSVAYPDPLQSATQYRTAMTDITEHRKAEDALRESELKYRKLFEESKDAILTMAADGSLDDANPAALELFGYTKEELRGVDFSRAFRCNAAERERFRQVLFRTGSVKDMQLELRRKNGETLLVHASASIIYDDKKEIGGYRAFIHDLTAFKKLEQQLLQAQKMESIGLLAGGVAHDFNNMLTAILGFGETIMETVDPADETTKSNIDRILEAAGRAKNLTGNLLAFSRKQVINPKPIAVNGTITTLSAFLTRIIGEDIELRTKLSDKEMTIIADTGQIEQVLINLATNARDAMPAGGRLLLETQPLYIGETKKKTYDLDTSGNYACISVTDTGVGIDAENMKRLFEPFYTTKGVGKGTGLGLSISYGIIKQHGGSIVAKSTPGKGATFHIYLPLTAARSSESTPPAAFSSVSGTETILVAEDEQIVMMFVKKILEKAGYTVITASDGAEALEKFKANKDTVSLVLSDMVMPKKNGREVCEEIRTIKPGIRTIFISGYTADIIDKKGILEKDVCFITKPFTKNDLLRKIREVLDGE
jgi:PAS domain S-box-containing protein